MDLSRMLLKEELVWEVVMLQINYKAAHFQLIY